MNVVRVAVLGTGGIVRAFHLPALAANSRARVVALCDVRADTLEGLAREYAVDKTYTDFERLAQDPEFDAVIVAIPNCLHAKAAVRLLQAGKHVFCEKPMAVSSSEARGMVAAADAAGKALLIGHVWRSHPVVRWLRRVVETGRLGTVFKVKAHSVVAGRGPAADSWFLRRETAGGGALIDVGVHTIDLVSYLFGDHLRPVSVSARLANNFRRLEVEDTADVRVEFDGGITMELSAGWYHSHAESPHGAVELFGTEGYARTMPARLKYRVEGVEGTFTPEFPSAHPDADLSVYAAQMDHFLDCVEGKSQPVCDGRQGLWNTMLVETAYGAARRGTSVVPEPVADFAMETADR